MLDTLLKEKKKREGRTCLVERQRSNLARGKSPVVDTDVAKEAVVRPGAGSAVEVPEREGSRVLTADANADGEGVGVDRVDVEVTDSAVSDKRDVGPAAGTGRDVGLKDGYHGVWGVDTGPDFAGEHVYPPLGAGTEAGPFGHGDLIGGSDRLEVIGDGEVAGELEDVEIAYLNVRVWRGV